MTTTLVRTDGPLRIETRLIASWARRQLHSTYRQSALRLVWAITQPLSVVGVYVVVFHWILRVHDDELPYLAFMVVGVTVWRYFAVGLNSATALLDVSHVLGKAYFPREVIPLSRCLAGLLDLGIGSVAMVTVAWAQGLVPRPTLLALPAVFVPLVLYTAAAATVLSTVTVFVRDLGHAMPTIQQLVFLATPIMYPARQLPDALWFLHTLNPLAVLAEQARDVTLRGVWPDAGVLAIHTIVGGLLAAGAIVYLRSIEHRIVDVA